MKNIDNKGFFIIIITICLCLAAFALSASAAGEIFINPDGGYAAGLRELFAVGGGGTASPLTGNDLWAITGSGLVRVGGAPTASKVPTPPPVGTINVKASLIRVGLDYYYSSSRNSSVSTARLQNHVGSGFRFGFYDANRNYFDLGATAERSLTMLIDRNIRLSAGTVGCYHMRLPGSYSSFEEAAGAASAYGGFPAYYDGVFYALAGSFESEDDALASGLPGEPYSASNRCVVVTKTGTTQILFEFDCGKAYSLAIRPVSDGEKAQTTYNGGNRYYGDFQFIRTTGENMTVVNVLPLEDYVKGVIPYEMSNTWPMEALKAQALCARTYVMRNINSYASYGFDVTDDTYCQAYLGTASANGTTDRAVEETAGLYVTYNGQLCETLYFSSDGGATEDSENIFPSMVPYLRGVIDPYEADINFELKSWSASFTAEQLTQKLRSKGYSISTIASVEPEYTRTGNMKRITFTDMNGKSVTVTKSSCYSALGLNGIHFTIEESNGRYLIEGGGWGHNVGMSQWGAYSMAAVHGYSFMEILGFYYTNITISRGLAG